MPVLHERLEFAEAVRLALEEIRPQIVAVELPASLESHVLRAVQRLPQVSVLLYESSRGEPLYLPICPADPLVEALRWAMEHGCTACCVDVDIDSPMLWHEKLPDSYAAFRLGHREFYQAVVAHGLQELHPWDRLREQGMALRLQRLLGQGGQVFFVCGMAHAQRILEDLRSKLPEPMDRVQRKGVQLFHLHPDSMVEIMTEPPLFHTIYEMRRKGLPPEPQDNALEPPSSAQGRLRLLHGGASMMQDRARACWNAAQWCARRCHRDLQESPAAGAGLRELLEDDGPQPPAHAHKLPMDRQKLLWRWLQRAARMYRYRTGESLQPWQVHGLMRFSRNYALLEGRLLPDFFQWVASAKACVDEDFAYEVWELGRTYPWQGENSTDLPTTRIRGEDLWLGMRRLRIRPRVPRKKRPQAFPVRQRKKETHPGQWAEALDGEALCSYPPEDLLVERFGGYLRQKGVRLLSEERSRVEPFTSSLLDGIDLRETLRNWHEGRIYVRETRRVRGGVGAVVVIFDPDEDGRKYPYCMTWYGEHEQESDMAFYATPLGLKMVGPGISRCEYGGFVMSYPPRRMGDIWKDPVYQVLGSKPEVLLMAALDYTLEPYVVYVAARPPRFWFHTLAARMGLKIVYLPLGQFSSATLKRLRGFHVLSGRDKRLIAKDYILGV
ncbi:MAG: hypothetical protein ACPF1Y_14715 [Desulfobacterota bacterium U4-17]